MARLKGRPPRSMVRTLRWRLLAVVAVFVVFVGLASQVGLRIIVDLNAERQAYLAGQTVATWGTESQGIRFIDPETLLDLAPLAAVVVLLDANDEIVAVSTDATIPLGDLEALAAGTHVDATTHTTLNGRDMAFTRVELDPGTVYREDRDIPLDSALVGVGTESADRLVRALFLSEIVVLGIILIAVSIIVTIVVARTTRTLSRLAERVEGDDLDGVRVVGAEFSETDELAAALVRLDAKRARSEEELRDFVADTSHELKTPLTKIQGWSELHFQDPSDTERTERALSSIVEESHRMRRLVDQLALLARADALTPHEHANVDLSALVTEFVDEVSAGSDASIVSSVDPDIRVLGDDFALTQILRNVVGNALVHAGDGAHVNLGLKAIGTEAVLSIEDDGAGIPPELLTQAFDRFTTGDRMSGSGLGLAIVRGIVTAHSGSIELTSALGNGTRVEIRLPLTR